MSGIRAIAATLCCLFAVFVSSAAGHSNQQVSYYGLPLYASAIHIPYNSILQSCEAMSILIAVQDGPHDGVAVYNVTLDHRVENGTIKLPFSFTYPTAAPADKLPLIMLMNGASVESYWYRRVIGDLASKGYVVASTDYYRERDFPASDLTRTPNPGITHHGCCQSSAVSLTCMHDPWTEFFNASTDGAAMPAEPGCREGVIIAPSAGFVNTLYNFIDGASKTKQGVLPDCLSRADTEQLLLLSHSLGGYVSFKLLGGEGPYSRVLAGSHCVTCSHSGMVQDSFSLYHRAIPCGAF